MHTRRLRLLTGSLLAVLVAMAAAACSDKPPADPGGLTVTAPPTIAALPKLDTPAGKALPLEPYMISDSAQKTISAARQILIAQCMKRFAFTFPAQSAARATADPLSRRYGITDLPMAQKWGYHLPPELTPVGKPKTPQLTDPAALLVLTGWPDGKVLPGATPPAGQKLGDLAVPLGGCSGEAARKLSGDDSGEYGDARLAQDLDAAANHQAQTDQRVVTANAEWSTCMKGKGYTYADPLAAADAIGGGPSVTPTEIQTAVTDITCKRQTNLIGTWFGVESAYQTALIQQHIQELTAIRDRITREVATATSVVAAG